MQEKKVERVGLGVILGLSDLSRDHFRMVRRVRLGMELRSSRSRNMMPGWVQSSFSLALDWSWKSKNNKGHKPNWVSCALGSV